MRCCFTSCLKKLQAEQRPRFNPWACQIPKNQGTPNLKNTSHFTTEGQNLIINFIIPLLLTAPINSGDAKDIRPVPSRSLWSKICLANALEEHGYQTKSGKQWGSSVDKALAKSMCTCRYEKLKGKTYMTLQEYVDAAMECREEFATDYMSSIVKYIQIYQKEQ